MIYNMPQEARESLRHFLSAAMVFKGIDGNPDMHSRTLAAFDEWFALGDAVKPAAPVAQADPSELDKMLVLASALDLTEMAHKAGVVVTVERIPLTPLAMGHAAYVISTRPLRGGK